MSYERVRSVFETETRTRGLASQEQTSMRVICLLTFAISAVAALLICGLLPTSPNGALPGGFGRDVANS
jgi:hypothetical protein